MDFKFPLQNQAPISQNFGENPEWYKHFNLPGHSGLDFAVPPGTPVLAAACGIVVKTSFQKDGYGNYIRIDHGNGFASIYAHLAEFQVRCNSLVETGQTIGLSGSTGFSTGPHLHFEIRKDNQPIDPAPFLFLPPIFTKNEEHPGGTGVARVIASSLNIRSAPSLSAPVTGHLIKNQKITILDRITTTWVKIGANAFVAHTFNNEPYLEDIRP